MKEFKDYNVSVILCTHKYVDYAEEQIRSIKNQINININIIISVDSDDKNTFIKWESLAKKYFEDKNISIVRGPMKGFSINFLNTILNLNPNSDYYAFSDHDDIWDKNKLYKAVEKLNKYDGNKPLLYGSRSRYIDENNEFISLSNKFSKNTVFRNALVQCFAGGNTMVFNNDLLKIIKKIGLVDVKSHDWWLYILVTSCEGIAIFDTEPHISYRQHSLNIVGGNKGIKQSLLRLSYIFNGDYRKWNQTNVYYLNKNIAILSLENKKVLYNFVKIQNGNIFERIFYYIKSGVYRQTFFQNLALFIFVLIKKI